MKIAEKKSNGFIVYTVSFFIKIKTDLFSTLTYIFLLFIISYYFKNKKLFFISIFIFYFFANGFIVNRIASIWEIPGENNYEINNHYCGIVLSGSFKYDRKLKRLIAAYDTDRIWQTIQLYKKGKIKKIVISGEPDKNFEAINDNHGDLKEILTSLCIPSKDIIEERISQNTCQSAQNCKKLLADNNYFKNKHLLITSSLHMKRALSCFKKQGVKVYPFCTDQINASSSGFNIKWIIPHTGNFQIWDKLFHEIFGYIYYKAKDCN